LGGGPALRTYFSEQRRWRDYEHETELQEVRIQRDEADRRLTVLQAQVEPHFLFNTLASVRSLVRADPSRAEATIDALVDHLRATLPKIRSHSNQMSSLAEQVEICRSYLDVMRVRMGDRLRYRVDVPEKLGHARFPPLMLISLVENAIKHGVEPKPGPCTVVILAREAVAGERSFLEVDVIDDGAGLRIGMGDGIGLSNIRAQLATRYGDRAALRLTAKAEGGVTATISLPLEGDEP
jgi:sensor histidine kinase YesM